MHAATTVIRNAAPGDGARVAALAALALGAAAPEGLAAVIDTSGGRIQIPHGEALCQVAVDAQGQVAGMVYSAPPVEWIEQHPASLHRTLARTFTKVELLAVVESQQHSGIGSALLTGLEDAERERGVQILFGDIRAEDRSMRRWCKKRGFAVAAPGEPVALRSTWGPLTLVDGDDGYLLIAKAVQPGYGIERVQLADGSFCLVVEKQGG
ncbi:GNAT family N-acetyltransferase [Streptomyces sp. H27-C3]|uniref:GNAT family N-acetyltransferase n=1 Tax=Streptomyces sp. H27-C3 TaxID=3046305 RepID=UPI0024BA23CD|nr:GNAT family N-acetyltransferase [Streptomyces sp. H27-C3]MDJ0463113.1 GNAT family N-acetyltransferase [Streptomyces sp. H27-C3]